MLPFTDFDLQRLLSKERKTNNYRQKALYEKMQQVDKKLNEMYEIRGIDHTTLILMGIQQGLRFASDVLYIEEIDTLEHYAKDSLIFFEAWGDEDEVMRNDE